MFWGSTGWLHMLLNTILVVVITRDNDQNGILIVRRVCHIHQILYIGDEDDWIPDTLWVVPGIWWYWKRFEGLELFFQAHGVERDSEVPRLLSDIGPKAFATLKNLTAPVLPAECDLKTLKEHLIRHFKLQPVVITKQFKFHKWDLDTGTTISVILEHQWKQLFGILYHWNLTLDHHFEDIRGTN